MGYYEIMAKGDGGFFPGTLTLSVIGIISQDIVLRGDVYLYTTRANDAIQTSKDPKEIESVIDMLSRCIMSVWMKRMDFPGSMSIKDSFIAAAIAAVDWRYVAAYQLRKM